jgi:glutamate---cysteine ligase / carboxylate-amine ligase
MQVTEPNRGPRAAVPTMRMPPPWAKWKKSEPFTVGVEEEVMLLHPGDWSLASEIDALLPGLPAHLIPRMSAETHGAALELTTGVHASVAGAAGELRDLRAQLHALLFERGLRAAVAGTHPTAVWNDTVISNGARYRFVHGSMRELARREPTFALHVHVGVGSAEDAIVLHDRLRAHLPLLLALSVNSPFWQGRDTGLHSARTPLWQAFPRVGIPRGFCSYDDYVETVELLIRSDAVPEPTFLWWDVRPRPHFGTVEVRVMDAQTTVAQTAALVALVQCLSRWELVERGGAGCVLAPPEVLSENRFLAARDGMAARFIDPARESVVPARALLEELLDALAPHAEALGCADALRGVLGLALRTGARRQLGFARGREGLRGVLAGLAGAFAPQRPATVAG